MRVRCFAVAKRPTTFAAELQQQQHQGASASNAFSFEYRVASEKSFDEAVLSVESKAALHGLRVVGVHDMAAQSVAREPLKIIELCTASFAHHVLVGNISVSAFLPCIVNGFAVAGKTFIGMLRPAAIPRLMSSTSALDASVVNELNVLLRKIIDESK